MQDHLLTRIKDKEPVLSELLFNGQDLSPLLLSKPHSLTELTLKCYKNGHFYMVKCQSVPFALTFLLVFWQPKYDFYLKRNKQIKELLNNIFVRLKDYGCKSVTLTENFAVVLSSNTSLACFCSGDVDLSADITEIEDITACLNSLNYFSKAQPKKIGEYSGQSMMFLNKDVIEGGFWVNVIWRNIRKYDQIAKDKSKIKI